MTSLKKKTTLLLIDVQNDFHPGGSLAIPTANEDADRIASLIQQHASKIDRIVATLDSHHTLHIAHPAFWVNGESGASPTPFTMISADDIAKGVWKPRPNLQLTQLQNMFDAEVFGNADSVLLAEENKALNITQYCLEYAKRLEAKGRFQICIWPEHCLMGSTGHALVSSVQEAIADWSVQTGAHVEFVMKGQNLLTEMYSALAAEVPVSKDTAFNTPLYDSLMAPGSQLLVCGQAMSHCVNYTVRDIVEHCQQQQQPSSTTADVSNIYLLTDCASAVPGFEAAADTFQEDMKTAGVQLIESPKVGDVL